MRAVKLYYKFVLLHVVLDFDHLAILLEQVFGNQTITHELVIFKPAPSIRLGADAGCIMSLRIKPGR